MIVIQNGEKFKQLIEYEKYNSRNYLYRNVFTDSKNTSDEDLFLGLYYITGKLYCWKPLDKIHASIGIVFTGKGTLTVNKEKFPIYPNDVLIVGYLNEDEIDVDSNNYKIVYEWNPLSTINTTVETRLQFQNILRKRLPETDSLSKVDTKQILGKGCYGNVFKFDNRVAVKISKIDQILPYTNSSKFWHEVFILNEILRPIIRKKICPNFPLLINYATIEKCKLSIRDEFIETPCITTIVELAQGTLKSLLQLKLVEEDYDNILFQIMAGVHAMQTHGQILNFDIKKENILFYKVEAGGYWKYKIHKRSYYIPNRGYLCVINDFGLSRSLSPEFPMYKLDTDTTFRLGSRFAIIENGKFVPIVPRETIKTDVFSVKWSNAMTTSGVLFRQNRKTGQIIPSLRSMSSTAKFPKNEEFFLQPDRIPPFEFFDDTQDVIRMFTGGARTTQRGDHKRINAPKEWLKYLDSYNSKSKNYLSLSFSVEPKSVLAGYFIDSFFSNKFQSIPGNEICLDIYRIS